MKATNNVGTKIDGVSDNVINASGACTIQDSDDEDEEVTGGSSTTTIPIMASKSNVEFVNTLRRDYPLVYEYLRKFAIKKTKGVGDESMLRRKVVKKFSNIKKKYSSYSHMG
jgi:hypothetical protein